MVTSLPTFESMVDNIITCWNGATFEDRAGGRDWYEAGHSYLKGLAETFDIPFDRVAGICAVLSPSVRWDRNLLETYMLLDGELEGFTAYGTNVAKAWNIKDGDLSQIRGPKVTAFYRLLVDPTRHTVVIDTWAIRIAFGIDGFGDVKGYNTPSRVSWIQQAYASAAILLEEKPSHVQAATWLTRRDT